MLMDGRYDEEDEEYEAPFATAERAATLQKCRVFNDTPLDEAACVDAMTEMLFLISTGTRLTEGEATDLFFMSTKLLQSSHPKLRRLHYVLMKELSPLVPQSFIASNSLLNHIKTGDESTKSNAIRALYAIMDNTLYGSLERTIAESMNSPSPGVVTAALVTGLHIAQVQPDMPKRWAQQLAEVMRARSKAQYAAIALLHRTRRNDRLSVARLVEQAQSGEIRSPLAVCLVVKMCGELMRDDFASSQELYRFVTAMLRNHSDLVVFEAARALASLPALGDREISPVVMTMQLHLRGSSVRRFAANLLISRVATRHPGAVAAISGEVENLVNDSNRVVATLAITTLLKTGSEATVERMLGQLAGGQRLSELGDEYKLVIVDAMRVLNAKFPTMYEALLRFLSAALLADGGAPLKQAVVDTMLETARLNPAAGETVLAQLAAYIEDCQFPAITKKILIHLADQVPRCEDPQRYVRSLYSYATLESASIRAVAVTTLAKLAARVPRLRRSIYVLLRRLESDTDDEVRDRAVLYASLFRTRDEVLIRATIEDVAAGAAASRRKRRAAAATADAPSALKANLEDLHAVAATANSPSQGGGPEGGGGAAQALSAAVLQGRDEMRHIQQLRELGEPLRSSEPLPLTDADNDYVVSVLKHVYAAHVVLQFRVRNTLDGLVFADATVVTDAEELEAEPLFAIPAAEVPAGAARYAYAVLRYDPGEFPSGTVAAALRFTLREEGEDGAVQADAEDYPLESFDLDIKDFVTPARLGGQAGFDARWAALEGEETAGTYSLRAMRNLTAAAHEIAAFFGMDVVGGVPERVSSVAHVLCMAGTVADAARTLVLVQAKVFIATDQTVALHLAMRGGSADLREYLASALLG